MVARKRCFSWQFYRDQEAEIAGTPVAIGGVMNDTKQETAPAAPAPKKAGGFRVQTGLRAAGEKLKYLEYKLEDLIVTG
jgi:hypothetical protein